MSGQTIRTSLGSQVSVTLAISVLVFIPCSDYALAKLSCDSTPQELCAAAPAGELTDDCLELASSLVSFETALCNMELGDPDYYPGYAANATFANGHLGEHLLGPGTWDALLKQLDRLASMGMSVIRLELTYPLLTPEFHEHLTSVNPEYDKIHRDYLQLYKDTVAEIRARGFVVAIEHSNMIPSVAATDPSSYYDFIKSLGGAEARARYRQERADEYKLMALELDPDYLTAVSEITTEAQAFGPIDGGDLFSPIEWQDYVEFAVNELPLHGIKLGAGAGVWESEEYVQMFASMPELDYIDLHFFPASNTLESYFDRFLQRVDLVRQLDPSKGITIGESWLYKVTGNELIMDPPDLSEGFSRDCYSYYEPLDQKFIELFSFASRLKRIDLFTPIWTGYFFAYMDYEALAPLTPKERLETCDQAALDNLAGNLTGTGELYKSLALQTNILVIDGVSPDHGPEAGPGTNHMVTISGQNFILSSLTGLPKVGEVRFGNTAATDLQVLDANTLTAVVPTGVDLVDVTVLAVKDWVGRIRTKPGAYSYDPPPVVAIITPNSGWESGGQQVYIEGENFVDDANEFVVLFGNLPASDVTVLTAEVIRAQTPAGVGLGTVDVSVHNPDIQWGVLENGYTFVTPPLISSVVPDSGPSSGGTLVSINGQNFMPGSPDTRVWIGPEASNVNVVSSTLIEAVTAPGKGTVPVAVLNPDGQIHQVDNVFTYVPAPVIVDVVPSEGPEEGGNSVWLGGANFQPGAIVTLGSQTATIVSLTPGLIEVVAPPGLGPIPLKVVNPDGQEHTWENPYAYVPPPRILSVVPASLLRWNAGVHQRPELHAWISRYPGVGRA